MNMLEKESIIQMTGGLLIRYFTEEIPLGYPFSFEKFRDNVAFFILHRQYFDGSKKKSLRQHRGNDNDDQRMMDSRYIKKINHNRDELRKDIKERTGIEIGTLSVSDMSSIKNKISGYALTKMQYEELQNLENISLFEAMRSRRICDVKKVSITDFHAYMQEYDKLILRYTDMLKSDDENIIFATLELFNIEWKYNIEFFYTCASYMEEHSLKEIPANKLGMLCGKVNFIDNEGNNIHTDSRFVLGRQEIVPMLFSEDEQEWGKITIKIREYLKASMCLRQKVIPRCKKIDDFYKNKPVHEWVNFLHENYDMQKLYVNKEWNNKKIRCFRNICRSMIAEDVPY